MIDMKNKIIIVCIIAGLMISCDRSSPPVLETGSLNPMPDEWIDKDTGHRIMRIVRREGDNQSFYFHNNPFIPQVRSEGDKMVFYGSDPQPLPEGSERRRPVRQLFTVNLKTFEIDQLTHSEFPISGEIVGKKRREAFFQSRDSVFAVNAETHEIRLIYVFPDSLNGSVTTLNADETLLAGSYSDRKKLELLRQFPRKGDYFTRIFEAKIPHTLITVDIETGIMKPIHSDTAWLNHIQFSPTDPDLLMFCHEGPWHLLDRIWTVNIQTGDVKLMHKRTVYREIAGHEFFSRDGNTIWFDLQIPRGETFYLAGLDMTTGVEKRYGLKRDEWSIHYNISPDQKLFAGDGGDSSQVARAKDGMWLYLFTPAGDSLKSERLVNMKNHDYELEPNVHFSPDGKWVIFRADFKGSGSQVYAVEMKKK
jgi:oligogalacturonide lyase